MLENGKKVVFVGVPIGDRKEKSVIRYAKQKVETAKKRYLKERNLNVDDVEFIDNVDVDETLKYEKVNEALWYTGRAIKRLTLADEAVFGLGMEKSIECIILYEACGYCGIPASVMIRCKEGKEDDYLMNEYINFVDNNIKYIHVW